MPAQKSKSKVKVSAKAKLTSKSKVKPKAKKSIKSKVDEALVVVSPRVQKHVDQLIASLQNTREARMGDLKWLASQILLRSKEISAQLKLGPRKGNEVKKTTKKITKKVKRTSVKK